MFRWIDDFLKPYQFTEKNKYSLAELCSSLAKEVLKLEQRITKLEAENVELTNALYEVENRLQAKIDNIHPVTYNLSNYTLDK
jgi:predicted  nucleic acid-binding Zn-ribbon protein